MATHVRHSCRGTINGRLAVWKTLLKDDVRKEAGVRVFPGLLDRPGILDKGSRVIVDSLIPDYQILDSVDYTYGVQDAYIAYATRGCPNNCAFCVVNEIEPKFRHDCASRMECCKSRLHDSLLLLFPIGRRSWREGHGAPRPSSGLQEGSGKWWRAGPGVGYRQGITIDRNVPGSPSRSRSKALLISSRGNRWFTSSLTRIRPRRTISMSFG